MCYVQGEGMDFVIFGVRRGGLACLRDVRDVNDSSVKREEWDEGKGTCIVLNSLTDNWWE